MLPSARVFVSISAVLVTTMGLAGCMTADSRVPIAAAPASPQDRTTAQAIEGDWISADGVAVTRFSNGSFQTLAADTGNKLADGSYRMADAQLIKIKMRSLIRRTTSDVHCAMITEEQLNCTATGGRQFVLMRRPLVRLSPS
jgi:hypothetical protein